MIAEASGQACSSLMSTPALNPRPSARSTTTRVPGSAPAAVSASARACQPVAVSAFTGGASTTTSTTPAAPGTVVMLMAPPLRSRVLAGHRHDLAGQVAGVVAGQERDHGRHLPRLGGPAERLAPGQLGEQLLGGGPGQERV